MCNNCFDRGYNDYPDYSTSSIEHKIDYNDGYKRKQNEIVENNDLEDVIFCKNCYENGVNNSKIGIWCPPLITIRGHYSSYEKGYYEAENAENSVALPIEDVFYDANSDRNDTTANNYVTDTNINNEITWLHKNKLVRIAIIAGILVLFCSIFTLELKYSFIRKGIAGIFKSENTIIKPISSAVKEPEKTSTSDDSEPHFAEEKKFGKSGSQASSTPSKPITKVEREKAKPEKPNDKNNNVVTKKLETSSKESIDRTIKINNLKTIQSNKSAPKIAKNEKTYKKTEPRKHEKSEPLKKEHVKKEVNHSNINSKTNNTPKISQQHSEIVKSKGHNSKHRKQVQAAYFATLNNIEKKNEIDRNTDSIKKSNGVNKQANINTTTKEESKPGIVKKQINEKKQNQKKIVEESDVQDENPKPVQKRQVQKIAKNAPRTTKPINQKKTASAPDVLEERIISQSHRSGRYFTFHAIEEHVAVSKKSDHISFETKYKIASIRLLNKADISNFSRNDLVIMLNEIYARHHLIFTDELLRGYFSQQKWYSGEYEDVDKALTDIEKSNIEYLKKLIH